MPSPGTIRLASSLNGLYRVAYTRRLGNIPAGSAVDLIPYRRIVEPGERIARIETLQLAAATFRQIAELTGETQWNRASDAASATAENIDLGQSVYLWRKEPGQNVLNFPGARIVSTLESRVLTVLRLSNGVTNLYLPSGSQNGAVEFQQTEVTPAIAPDSEILVELAANVEAIAILVLQSGEARWEAAIALTTPALSIQAIAGQDFLQWSTATEWHPSGGSSETFVQGSGVATRLRQNVAIDALHPLVETFTLISNLGAAGARLLGSFGTTPAPVFYATNNLVRLRLQDGAGWFWETLLQATGGQFQTRTLSWSDFLLSISQQDGGALPLTPSQQAPIQQYEFLVTQDTATLSIQYVGAPPSRLSTLTLPTRFAIGTQESAPHILSIGDVVLSENPVLPYNLSQRDLQVLANGDRKFRGSSLTWQQRDGGAMMHQFWADAQAGYEQATGVLGPFQLAYRWRAEGVAGFTDQDDLYDLAWGGWQAKTGAIACQDWYETGGDVIQQVSTRWIEFLDRQWGGSNAVILDPFSPLPQQRIESLNSPIPAWYLEAALYANLAGGDRMTTYRVLSKAIDLLLLQVNFDVAVLPNDGGEGAIAIFHALARLLRHQQGIRYPTPSETGDLDSDFAVKTAKIMAFEPALNLPAQTAYGFRYRVPMLLEPD